MSLLKKTLSVVKDTVTDPVVKIVESTLSEIIMKRYKLSDEAKRFARGPVFMFRVAFSKQDGTTMTVCSQKKCPIIHLPIDTEITTSDRMAQLSIENFILPDRTKRNGQNISGSNSMAFVEVLISDSNVEALNLDATYFK